MIATATREKKTCGRRVVGAGGHWLPDGGGGLRWSRRTAAERNALVEANTGLVGWVVNRHRRHPAVKALGNDDAVQAGHCGLLRAAELWDESRGCTFSTYAPRWVWQHVARAWDEGGRLVHVPAYLRKVEGRAHPDRQEAAARALDVRRLPCGRAAGDHGPEAPPWPPGDALLSATLEKEVRRLGPRVAQVLRWRVWDGLTLDEVGAKLGVTRERVRQIQADGLDRLRSRLGGRALR